MKWQKKLTKKERMHMKEFCGNTIEGLKRNREKQQESVRNNPDCIEPCWDCKMIARKLGIETP